MNEVIHHVDFGVNSKLELPEDLSPSEALFCRQYAFGRLADSGNRLYCRVWGRVMSLRENGKKATIEMPKSSDRVRQKSLQTDLSLPP